VTTPSKALYTLVGHEGGVNSVSYCTSGEKPYLVSGSDDFTVKVWDYQTKNCLATLEGHQDYISSVLFHPDLPIIVSTSEDNTVKIWNALTFKLETTLEYSLDRPWCCGAVKEVSIVALGYDEGTVVVKLGSDYPMADFSNGKIVAAKGSQLMTYNVKILQSEELSKGEKIHVTFKELGNADMYVQGLRFNANGQSFAIFGESDYAIYNSRSFKSAGYGVGSELVWSKGDLFGVKLDNSIKIIKRDQDLGAFKLGYRIDAIFGGDYLAVRSDDSIAFFDWETQAVIRRIEIAPRDVLWSEDGTKVALLSDEGIYILNCNKKAINEYLSQGEYSGEGLESAFELENELTEIVSYNLTIG